MFSKAMNCSIAVAMVRAYKFLTSHHQLHKPEHIGAFAGSYLRRGDWDHD
jgi:hypothetical protein